jgi:RNA polymerase sigma-70 factor (ECF subfamily)
MRVVIKMEREVEIRLVNRLKCGDPAAFETVYEALRPRLFSFLIRLCRRTDVAEDLLEETWLRLATHANALTMDTRLAAWLFTVARNLHVSWRRRQAIDSQRISELTPCWPEPETGETPYEAAARNETERRLETALARLPVSDREVLLLVSVEGFSHSEAALLLELTPESWRKRLQRARERLAAKMNQGSESRQEKTGQLQ